MKLRIKLAETAEELDHVFRLRHGALTKLELFHKAGIIARNTFYLLAAGLVVLDLMRSALTASQQFRGAGLAAGAAPLDSFSEPSTAAAILKQEAETLLFDYTEARNAALASEPSGVDDSRQTVTHGLIDANPIHFAGFARGSAREVSRVRPLEKLEATIQDLDLDLQQKLLLIYSENHFENELLDTFLRLLEEAPERSEILEWVRSALECSRQCGRTEEVKAALRHTLRFHPNLRTAKRLAALVQCWELEHQTRPGAE